MTISVEIAAAVFAGTVTIFLALIGTIWGMSTREICAFKQQYKENGKSRNSEIKDRVTEKLCAARMDGVRAEIEGLSGKIDTGFADLRETTGRILTRLNRD